MKPDERRLLLSLLGRLDLLGEKRHPRYAIEAGGFIPKRAHYLLDKWARKGWYDYGVCLDLGWLTPLGVQIAKALSAIERNEPMDMHPPHDLVDLEGKAPEDVSNRYVRVTQQEAENLTRMTSEQRGRWLQERMREEGWCPPAPRPYPPASSPEEVQAQASRAYRDSIGGEESAGG